MNDKLASAKLIIVVIILISRVVNLGLMTESMSVCVLLSFTDLLFELAGPALIQHS